MYRTHNCGELNSSYIGQEVTLCGWVQRLRNKGFIIWVDLRDRYGLTQIVFDQERTSSVLFGMAETLNREFVLQVKGKVIEREAKNKLISTGDIELLVTDLQVLNPSEMPPFTIEDQTDGGEDLRMKYRYLDIRRNHLKNNLLHRHKVAQEVRKYLSALDFVEVETPFLIKSTPEGARDFVVPSRMNPNQFYALPQSPQTFKQLLMVGGLDRYFQIVRCFRDEDLRSDRQPEFTQIDCEMAFVDQEDVLQTFEGLVRHLLREINGVEIGPFPRMTYEEAMANYGVDKPDIRFDMKLIELTDLAKGKGFKVFDEAEAVIGICVKEAQSFTRKDIDKLVDFVKQPQVGGSGLVWARCEADGSVKSSVDKFYTPDDLKAWADKTRSEPGSLILIMSGHRDKIRKQLGVLRLHLAEQMGLRQAAVFAPLWVLDFPLLEWSEADKRFYAMHHPFTAPKPEDIPLLKSHPEKVRANAYDMVLNGNEIGGGSIRIFDKTLQRDMFGLLGFSPEEAQSQFGFLMEAFKYGAPPHGGIAFGFDRLTALLAGKETIRDFIAFPKNNLGRDVMINAPDAVSDEQLKELHLSLVKRKDP